MKKSKWLGSFALIIALVMSFALIGCGDPANGGVSGGGKVNGDTKPEDIISQQLTEEQWKEAFDDNSFTNYTLKGKFTETDGEQTAESNFESKVDANKSYSLSTSQYTGENYESYTSIENGIKYFYDYDETTRSWSREKMEDLYEGDNDIATPYLRLFGHCFSDFTYDKDVKSYLAEICSKKLEDKSIMLQNITLKFVNERLSYAAFTSKIDTYKVDFEYMFYDYGTTSVTLPTITVAE